MENFSMVGPNKQINAVSGTFRPLNGGELLEGGEEERGPREVKRTRDQLEGRRVRVPDIRTIAMRRNVQSG